MYGHHAVGWKLQAPHKHTTLPVSSSVLLQAHKQTIDVLVEEKTALQSKLSAVQLQLQNKTSELPFCHGKEEFLFDL